MVNFSHLTLGFASSSARAARVVWLRVSVLFVLVLPASGVAQNIDTTTPKHAASNIDEKLLLSINHYGVRHPWLDVPMKGLSNSAVPVVVAVPLVLYGYGVVASDRDEAITGASIALSELVSGLFVEGVKQVVRRDRPYHVLEDVRTPGGGASGFSFPSGHATSTWALAAGLYFHYPKYKVIIPAALYAAAVSISRPYLGVHYVSDILTGAAIGIGTSYLAYRYEEDLTRMFSWLFPSPRHELDAPNELHHGVGQSGAQGFGVRPIIAPGLFSIQVNF